mgnify:FL=1
MGTRLAVIVPVVNTGLADKMFASIERNTVHPQRILIIDNSNRDETYNPHIQWRHLELTVMKYPQNIGVNESWNVGIKHVGKCDLLSILNDDIILNERFFERLVAPFQLIDCAVICPQTENTIENFERAKLNAPLAFDVAPMKRREGWAFTYRKDILDKLPRIPVEQFRTFCGDDWFWYHTAMLKYRWYRDFNNVIYHKVGASLDILPDLRETLRAEKEAFALELQKIRGVK